jgi:hypothetical protein
MIRTKPIEAGDWRTVEGFWNASGTAFFRLPVGVSIKVRTFVAIAKIFTLANGCKWRSLA